ncbi:FUSC family protein [Roseateles sp.]|uniref:FUSC family protein n=1 Tax=Roseateles sp. TaxID=1971397 RepID=UPI0039E88E57
MKLPELPRFTPAELLFSAKCFAAAMLAMFLASWAGQPRPFWALMTTYVVAHPLAGAVRSKAMFRLLGTGVGSVAAVLLVPGLANAPELLSLALALWVALCLFCSLQDRTPRAYAFMLAGYTAALIGFPAVDQPLQIFDTAVARVEEIGLGILAATLVHSLVLPTGLSASVLGLVDRSLGDTRRWLGDLLQGRGGAAAPLQADRRRVAGDITQLRLLSTHIPYDTSALRWSGDSVHALQDRIAALTQTLAAAEDRLEALRQHEGNGLPADVDTLLAALGDWLQQAEPERRTREPVLRAAIAALPSGAFAGDDWGRALRIALAARLDELLLGWQQGQALRAGIDAGMQGGRPQAASVRPARGAVLHLDAGMAAWSALAAAVAIGLCCAFWILTGWPMGSAAAMMAAIFCSFFAGMDDPVPAIHGFMKWTLWSIPIAALYLLVLLPLVQDFATLALVCAPLVLPLGALVARPATMGQALPLLFGVVGALAMHDTAQADLVSFLNSMLGQVVGILVAARTTRLLRSVGADWSARRIQRATWRELAELARAPRVAEREGQAYGLRMLDRVALLAPRVAQSGGSVEGVPTDDALRDLRLGADLLALQRARTALPGTAQPALQGLLDELATLLPRHARPPQALLARLDELLRGALAASADAAVGALVGLRRHLFPDAEPLAGATTCTERSVP